MTKKLYLVLWWMSQEPYAAAFENEEAAKAAANVRNALLLTFSGSKDIKVDEVVDYYRRAEDGSPMPANWRDLLGNIRLPWTHDSKENAK